MSRQIIIPHINNIVRNNRLPPYNLGSLDSLVGFPPPPLQPVRLPRLLFTRNLQQQQQLIMDKLHTKYTDDLSRENYNAVISNIPVLEHHKFIDKDITLAFYTYYNDLTPIMYELEPFLKPLRINSLATALRYLPATWVTTVRDLDKSHGVFNAAPELHSDHVFVRVQSIQYLMSFQEDKFKNRTFIQHLYDMCLTGIEHDRLVHDRNSLCRLKYQTAKHANSLDFLKETLDVIKTHHSDIEKAIGLLVNVLTTHSLSNLKL